MARIVIVCLTLIVFGLGTVPCPAQPAAVAEPPAVATLPDTLRPVSRDRQGWMERHEAMNRRVAEGNVDLIFIGDSITHGWEGSGREVWEKYYGKRNAANLGIGGDRTQHVLWRLANGNIKGIAPKLAVIMIGTNNSGSDSPTEIAAAIQEIVQVLRKKLPETKVLLLAIFPRGENAEDPKRKVNEATNAIIKDLDDGKMVHYLNINEHFLADDGVLPREIMPDLLHPRAKGYGIWADAMEPKIKELMGEK